MALAERRVFVGLGSNQGDRAGQLGCARVELEGLAGLSVVQTAPIYESEAIGPAQGPFLNSAVELQVALEPRELLAALKGIERRMGRVEGLRWGPRPIDLDILLWADRVIAEPDLQVPHLRLHQRAFALAPLVDLCPEGVHPVLRERLKDLLAQVSNQSLRPFPPTAPA